MSLVEPSFSLLARVSMIISSMLFIFKWFALYAVQTSSRMNSIIKLAQCHGNHSNKVKPICSDNTVDTNHSGINIVAMYEMMK